MTSALPPAAALRWLAAMTPGLRAAALVAEDGHVLAGDAALAAAVTADHAPPPDAIVVRRGSLTLVARVGGRVLRGLLEADMATTLAAAGPVRVA